MKDWKGNKNSTFSCLGASNHVEHDRAEYDYYATEPIAAELLLQVEPELDNIWECACGGGHLAKVFEKYGKLHKASDVVNRGYGMQEDFLYNILNTFNPDYKYIGDIVTNPPYKYATEFVKRALNIVPENRKVCMFLKVLFLESNERKELFKEYPPQTVYVCSNRIKCALNGNFDDTGSSAVAYAWFVWQKGYKGNTVIKWIN